MLTRKILIVDDSPADRESVAMALRRDPRVRYHITEAETGQQGLEQLDAHPDGVDLVFLDFMLPDMDALSFVDKLLTDDDVPPVPIVVLTGSMPPEARGKDTLDRGVQDFFTKAEATTSIVSRIADNAIQRHKLLRRAIASERRASEAMEKAERADRAKSQFLALVSHELRTPLTAVLGLCRLLETDPDCEDREEMLRMVISSGEHLEELLNDLIDLAKVEAGTLELDPTDFDPRELVRTTLAMFDGAARLKGIGLQADFDGSTPVAVRADAVRFRQILVNLVGNAIKFTDKGAVRAAIGWDSDGARLELRVTDTGPGIPPALTPNLFTPFKQGETNAARKRVGVGLGLSISKQLAEMMGGNLSLARTGADGSEFVATVEAPRVLDYTAPRTAEEASVADGLDLAGTRILVADDVRANRFLLQRLLAKTGAEVTVVADGAAVLDALGPPEDPAFELILMDMMMPKIDGYEATREIRQRGHTAPVIALTAAVTASDRDNCLAAGCFAVVTKPIDTEQFYSAVGRAFQRD